MARTVSIGAQNFEKMILNDCFYVDKTLFIKKWPGSEEIKIQFEELLSGKTIQCQIDEEIVYNQLGRNENAVWSLLLASGYLKVAEIRGRIYELALTNYETKQMFEGLVLDWFGEDSASYIEDRQYEQTLLDHGICHDHIRKYGFAFQGKKVLIG